MNLYVKQTKSSRDFEKKQLEKLGKNKRSKQQIEYANMDDERCIEEAKQQLVWKSEYLIRDEYLTIHDLDEFFYYQWGA